MLRDNAGGRNTFNCKIFAVDEVGKNNQKGNRHQPHEPFILIQVSQTSLFHLQTVMDEIPPEQARLEQRGLLP